MEALTKRILAIVLIAVIGVGVGVGAWIFLLAPGAGEYDWSAEDCPGAPTDITEDQIIKVGVIGDMARAVGQGQRDAALLAAEEINTAGGITMGVDKFYFGVVWVDSDENNPIFDQGTAVSAAKKLINYYKPLFATGSSRTEAALAYQPLFLEKKMIFINTGAATTSLCEPILNNATYDEYKYYFQISPTNTTALAMNLITLIVSTSKLYSVLYAKPVTRFSFMREDLSWTADFKTAMQGALTYYNLTYTGADIAFPQDVTTTEMDAHFNTIVGNNTQIVIPIISGDAGIKFANSYGDLPGGQTCIPIGINVLAQDSGFWSETGGRCNYSIGIDTLYETNKTSRTLPFYYAYKAAYGVDPLYTASGTYDTFNQLKWLLESSMSLDPDYNVGYLESNDKASGGIEGAGGYGAYNPDHSPVYGWPFGIGLAVQWINGEKNFLVAPGLYPSDPYSTIAGAPPYGIMLNQTLMTLPPDFYWAP